MVLALCLKCLYFHQSIESYAGYQAYLYYNHWYYEETIYECDKLLKVIRKLRKKCKHYQPYTQTKLRIEVNGMVKTEEIPSEGARMDLQNLPAEIDLKALEESTVAESAGKSGGLKITFENRQGAKVTQKYTQISGAKLQEACRRLKIKDTEELQTTWYHYKLTDMRMGYARFIPVSKCKEQ